MANLEPPIALTPTKTDISAWLSTTATVLATIFYYASVPIIQLLRLVVLILTPFWTLIKFVLLPVTYTVRGILAIILFPVRLRLLERLETIYIYVGIAALVGCLVGAILHVIFNLLSSTLAINGAAEPRRRTRTRTVAEYRADRQKAILDEQYGISASVIQKRRSKRKQGVPIPQPDADVDDYSSD